VTDRRTDGRTEPIALPLAHARGVIIIELQAYESHWQVGPLMIFMEEVAA
jgi:hypothetical protein